MHWIISKTIRQCACSALTALVLTVAGPLHAEPADVRLLVDVSGSMKSADPNAVRGPATALLATLLPQNSQGGIWLFGSDVRTLVPHGPVDARWSALSRPISSSIGSTDRFTHIESAIKAALSPTLQPDAACHVILITDGIVDVQGGIEASAASRDRLIQAQIPDAQNKGCRIHTIALSDQADLPLLTQMALQTGGLFTLIDQAGDLIPVMLDALELALKSQQLPVLNREIKIDADIDQLRLIRLENDQPLELKTNGRVFNAQNPADGQEWFEGDGYQAMLWSAPTEGVYRLSASTASDRVLIDSSVTLQLVELPPTLAANQTLGLAAEIMGPDGVLENSQRQFRLSFGEATLLDVAQGSRLQTQIDSPPTGRALLTLQSLDDRHTRQIQRAFQVLDALPALDVGNNTSEAVGTVAPQVQPSQSTLTEKRAPSPAESADSGTPASMLLPAELSTWPLWQLGLLALVGIALIALLVGAFHRPTEDR